MARAHGMLLAAILPVISGCATGPSPAPADYGIDFVRGCWVQKREPGAEAQAFLRLLPREDRLVGQIAHVNAGDWRPDAGLSFTEAGDSADFSLSADAPLQTDFRRMDASRLGASFAWARAGFGGAFAAFAGAAPARRFLFVEATPERISIWSVSADPDATLIFRIFDGERDGCD